MFMEDGLSLCIAASSIAQGAYGKVCALAVGITMKLQLSASNLAFMMVEIVSKSIHDSAVIYKSHWNRALGECAILLVVVVIYVSGFVVIIILHGYNNLQCYV